jgi:hypothetical protein
VDNFLALDSVGYTLNIECTFTFFNPQGVIMATPKISAKQKLQLDMEKLRIAHEEKELEKKYKLSLKQIQMLEKERVAILGLKGNIITHKIVPEKGRGNCNLACFRLARRRTCHVIPNQRDK